MSVARGFRAATAVTRRGFWVSERFFVSPAERGRREGAIAPTQRGLWGKYWWR
jgi:hypothetical protein